jgi:hypothetical protein
LAVLTILLLVLSRVLAGLGKPLITTDAPRGILSFEFARSTDEVARILDSWSPAARDQAILSLGIDYLYLFIYPAWFSLACVLLSRRLSERPARLGRALAWIVLSATALDAAENYALIQLMAPGPSDVWPPVSSTCASLKFILILAAGSYVLAAGSWLIWRRLRELVRKHDA